MKIAIELFEVEVSANHGKFLRQIKFRNLDETSIYHFLLFYFNIHLRVLNFYDLNKS